MSSATVSGSSGGFGGRTSKHGRPIGSGRTRAVRPSSTGLGLGRDAGSVGRSAGQAHCPPVTRSEGVGASRSTGHSADRSARASRPPGSQQESHPAALLAAQHDREGSGAGRSPQAEAVSVATKAPKIAVTAIEEASLRGVREAIGRSRLHEPARVGSIPGVPAPNCRASAGDGQGRPRAGLSTIRLSRSPCSIEIPGFRIGESGRSPAADGSGWAHREEVLHRRGWFATGGDHDHRRRDGDHSNASPVGGPPCWWSGAVVSGRCPARSPSWSRGTVIPRPNRRPSRSTRMTRWPSRSTRPRSRRRWRGRARSTTTSATPWPRTDRSRLRGTTSWRCGTGFRK